MHGEMIDVEISKGSNIRTENENYDVLLIPQEKQQIQSRIRKVATLARTGEKGRALAAARNAPPVPVTEQIVQEIRSLYRADPEPPAPASAPISALFLSEVAEHVPTTPKDAYQDHSARVRNIGMTLAPWR